MKARVLISIYGATTIAGPKGESMPSENELAAAKFQGEARSIYCCQVREEISK